MTLIFYVGFPIKRKREAAGAASLFRFMGRSSQYLFYFPVHRVFQKEKEPLE